MKKRITTAEVPMPKVAEKFVSTAIEAGGCVYLSGQVPIDAAGNLQTDSLESEVHQVMHNMTKILEAAGCSLHDLVKVTIYLSNFEDFPKVNELYASYFDEIPPARTTVEVSGLYMGVRVEIDAIAVKS